MLLPRPRLIIAACLGAPLVALAAFSSLFWLLAIAYYVALALVVSREAWRLPRAADFTARRSFAQPLSLGATEPVAVSIQCARAANLLVSVADHVPPEVEPNPAVQDRRFGAAGMLQFEYVAHPVRRGAFNFGPLDLRVRRPEGWVEKHVHVRLAEPASVYPNVQAVRRYELLLRRGIQAFEGLRRTRPPGASTAFAALRDYVPGDDIRRVNWKATARRDRPVTTEVEAERGQQVVIALDCGRLMTAPAGALTKLDHAVNAGLLLAWVSERHGDRVGLVAFSDAIDAFLAPQRGRAQVARINHALYEAQARYVEPDFGFALASVARRLGGRSLVVILTDVLDREASAELVTHALWLGRRHLVLVVAMQDPALVNALERPIDSSLRAYEWAAAEELASSRRESFETLQRGGVLSLDVSAQALSPSLVERYLELKERALL